ncbi:hypothetical protein ACWGBX_04690, partial [Streptomyces sp. NPDC055037]
TYLALTFGTLLSSQGTDASFVLTLSGFPPGFPFGLAFLRFRLYQTLSRPIPRRSGAAFQFSAFAFPFPAIPTLSDSFGVFRLVNSDDLRIGLAFRLIRL